MGREDGAVNTIVGKGATFDGLLEISGGLRIDGNVKGKVISADVVLVGPSGVVDADIEAKETIVGGLVKGNVKAPDKVELQAKSQVEGDIVTYSLVVEQGAMFHGNCQMRKDKTPSASVLGSQTSSKGSDGSGSTGKGASTPTYQKAKA